MQTNILTVGNGAREHAMAEALAKSNPRPTIFAWMKTYNPGIAALADKFRIGSDYTDIPAFAKECGIHLAIIGPEEPLMHGVVDALGACGIPTVGSTQSLARIETSKSFTRSLIARHGIPGNPIFKIFKNMRGIEKYLKEHMPVALKPDGLTGGKGVKVQGDHFTTVAEALKICEEILEKHFAVVVEKKLEGEEFSLQCFCDGESIVAMPPVQDHKRRLVGDQGLNTGSMGSYSCANHLLPFLTQSDLGQAVDIIRQTIKALQAETGKIYKGIIYGGFMATADGVKLIEFNARFGDPEAINVLSLLETDFLDVCWAIVTNQLGKIPIKFRSLATVVKYVVPVNYGLPKEQRVATNSDLIQIGDLGQASLYYSSVNSDQAGCHLTSSRAVAILGVGETLSKAEKIAEQAALNITGAVAHRPDIGTAALIARRVRHMKDLRRTSS